MDKKLYNNLLAPLHLELVAMARWARREGERICVLFEGRDTSGKGGTIRTIDRHINPRQLRVVALPKPSDVERTQWYFQRYVPHLPAAGEIVLFDRSWYNRAGVENVMGFATDAEVAQFLEDAPVFEKMLVDSGVRVIKYWLSCDQQEQDERFASRMSDPLKRWKLSPIDLEASKLFAEYTAAREVMFAATHTEWAPWTVVDFNDQRHGRLTLIRDLLDRIPYTAVPEEPPAWPPVPQPPLHEDCGMLAPLAPYPLDAEGFDFEDDPADPEDD
jgi:polyphosphate kinase 2